MNSGVVWVYKIGEKGKESMLFRFGQEKSYILHETWFENPARKWSRECSQDHSGKLPVDIDSK